MPKTFSKYACISSLDDWPFLFLERRHSLVVSSVPLPSLSMEPPSRTKFKLFEYSPLNIPESKRRDVIRLSLSAANFRPQPLNLKSLTTGRFPRSVVMEQVSRAQVSFVGHLATDINSLLNDMSLLSSVSAMTMTLSPWSAMALTISL